jgi:uncharacterized membrane protein YagU involved in acid resistance
LLIFVVISLLSLAIIKKVLNSGRYIMELDENPSNLNLSSKIYAKKEQYTRPWLRFCARFVDLCVFSILFEFIVALLFPSYNLDENSLTGMLILFSWFIVEPIILLIFGTVIPPYNCPKQN